MIKIVLIRDKDKDEFGFTGHANSAPKGKDIVCSSVSTLVEYLGFASKNMNEAIGKPDEPIIDAGNTVITFHKPNIEINDEKVSIKTNDDIHNYSYFVAYNVVVTSAIDLLGRLSKEYPDFISFKIYKPKENVEPDTKDIA